MFQSAPSKPTSRTLMPATGPPARSGASGSDRIWMPLTSHERRISPAARKRSPRRRAIVSRNPSVLAPEISL